MIEIFRVLQPREIAILIPLSLFILFCVYRLFKLGRKENER